MKKFGIPFLIATFIFTVILINSIKHKDVTVVNATYSGENENWHAVCKVSGKGYFVKNERLSYKTEVDEVFTLTFKGDISQIENASKLSFSFKSESINGGSNFIFKGPVKKKVFSVRGTSRGAALPDKEEFINVSVLLDDKEENFIIKMK